jgi:hypothetical protein
MRFYILSVLSLTLGLALLLPGTSVAQTIHQVSPRTIERTVTAGDIIRTQVTVTNTYPYVINVFPSVHDLIIDTSSATATRDILVTEDSQFIAWTILTRAAQRLQPGEAIDIDVQFTVPRSIEPGTYHGLLGFGQGIDRPTAEQAVLRGTAPGVVVRFTVPEPDVQSDGAATLDISEYIVTPTQTALSYTLYNPGTRPMQPAGDIIVRNQRGAEIAAIPINVTDPIAPGEIRTVATTVPALSLPGRYTAAARVDFKDSQVALVQMSDAFWYVPWQILLAILGVILLLSMLVYRYVARHVHPRGTSDGQTATLPLHIYQGESEPEDHDINLRT